MYKAELHRGESVLTASQSDLLKSIGLLKPDTGGTTKLDMDAFRSARVEHTNTLERTTNNTTKLNIVAPPQSNRAGGSVSMSMGNIVVQVQGSNASADDIAKAVQRELNKEINKAAAVLGYA